MKKLFGRVFKLWCMVCGLIVPPALLGVALAQSLGVLDLHSVVDRIEGRSRSGEAGAGEAGIVPVTAEMIDGEAMPIEAYAWRRHLGTLDARIGEESAAVTARETAVTEREEAQERVAGSIAEFLEDLFEVPVSPASVIEDPAAWRDRLLARSSAEADRPRLLKMLQTVEKDALAEILATPGESNGIDEYTVTRLMEELPPARAGDVITELGRRDPALAARIIARLEKSTGSSPSREDSAP